MSLDVLCSTSQGSVMYSWQEAMRILLDMGSSPSTPLGAESGSGACDGLDRASDRAKLEARPRFSFQRIK
jgi:hypothetical protein